MAASFLGSDPSFSSRATFTSKYLDQKKGQQERGEGHPSQRASPAVKSTRAESQSSGKAGCLVHAVPGAATAASEYKLLKVSEYEAKLLKVRGSDSRSKRDMDQWHVLYTQMP